jgi:hypothetical protein
MIIARTLAIAAGLLILAAVAHATIYFTTGYGTPHAYLTITVAIGVAVASVICGMATSRGLAVFLAVCIASGEGYNFLQSANRLIAASEAAQAPKREYVKAYAKAKSDVTAAQAIVDAPQTSQRLREAQHAKELADRAVTDKSAEKGCLANCRQLLQAAVDSAAEEVTKARDAIEVDHKTAVTNLNTAKTKADGMNAPESPTPLADRLGVEPWKIDVLIAALGSIAINGLACGLMIFGAHGTHRREKKPVPPAAEVIDITPGPTKPRLVASNPPAISVIEFAAGALERAPSSELEFDDFYMAYWSHCKKVDGRAVSPTEAVEQTNKLCGECGIPIQRRGKKRFLVGVRIKTATAQRPRLGSMAWRKAT